jgi:hypothetical protein
MFKRVLFLILSLAVLVGMGLATSAAFAANGVYGQERWRWEGWNNHMPVTFDEDFEVNVVSPAAKNVDDSFGYSFLRSRFGYSTDIGEHGMFNVEFENTRILGGGSALTDWNDDLIALHEGYLGMSDFIFKGFDVYAGRFGNLSYGRERIIGPEDWSFYIKNRFDGFKGHYMFEKGWFDLLCLKLSETLLEKYDTTVGDVDMRGGFVHYDAMEGLYVEPYILWWSQDNYHKNPDLKNDNYFLFGALVDYMSDSGLHLYGEGVIETGTAHVLEGATVAENKLSTFGAYVGAFYEMDMASRPFIGAEFNYASGTKAGDTKMKTFRSPFGSYSTYMGIMNVVDWSNTASLRFSGGLSPIEKTDVKLDFYLFRLAQADDFAYGGYSLFNVPGMTPSVLAGIPETSGKFNKSVGTEFDLMINHQIEENVTLQGGAAMFNPGDYFGKNGTEDWDNTLYGWIGAQVQF